MPHFPAALTFFERMLVHQLAESAGLMHESVGRGVSRRIKVWKVSAGVGRGVSLTVRGEGDHCSQQIGQDDAGVGHGGAGVRDVR